MPSKVWPLWLLTVLVLAGFPAVNFIYWPEVLRSGVLPPEGDSVGIPMFGSLLLALVASPFVLGVTWLFLRRYNPATRITAWRSDRLLRSVLTTIVFGAAALVLVAGTLVDFPPNAPWYEYLWPTYAVFAAWWLLALRAAAVEQLEYEPTYTER